MAMTRFTILIVTTLLGVYAHAQNQASIAASAKAGATLECENGITFKNVSSKAQVIQFVQKEDIANAKLNDMEECKARAGKFLCFHANSETMINLPLDVASKHSGDRLTVFINDDADDVTGNGKSYSCTVK
jgi:hypothetical protein